MALDVLIFLTSIAALWSSSDLVTQQIGPIAFCGIFAIASLVKLPSLDELIRF